MVRQALCPLASSVLYLHYSSSNASPKAISGRTSYLRVRLEFLPYPHLIRAFFNRHRFEPPRSITFASLWTWVDHTVSGLQHATIRPIKTRFPCGYSAQQLNLATHRNSLARSTKSTPLRQLWLLVGIRFQVLFHSPCGVLFTFPSRYCSLSVIRQYLALGGGPPIFPQSFTCSVVLVVCHHVYIFAYKSITFYGVLSHALRLT